MKTLVGGTFGGKSPGVVGFRGARVAGADLLAGVSLMLLGWAIA